MKGRLGRPSPATVVAVIALFLALSTSGYAAIKANTVGAKQIKNNAVRGPEIQDGAVGTAEVADNALGSQEILDETLTGGDVRDGALGGGDVQDESLGGGDVEDGSLSGNDVGEGSLGGGDVQDESMGSGEVQGLTAGDVEPSTFLGLPVTVQFERATSQLTDGTSQSYTVFCPAGQTAVGGGFNGDDTDPTETRTGSSRPVVNSGGGPPADGQTFTGWRATVLNPTGGVTTGINPEVWVVCVRVP